MDDNKIKEGVRLILEGVGEDITREGLIETPDRIASPSASIICSPSSERPPWHTFPTAKW